MLSIMSKRNPDVELTLQKDTNSDRKQLLKLKHHPCLGDKVDVIYIYSLLGEGINYPNGVGSIIYIGEAGRDNKTGVKFSQHISTGEFEGGDTGTKRGGFTGRVLIEPLLFQQHLKVFGALPIGQGASGRNCTISSISALEIIDVLKEIS